LSKQIKNEITKDVTNNLTQDITQNVTNELTKNITKDITNELSKQIQNKIKKTLPHKKNNIPHTIKRIVWNNWIGESIGCTMCLCCKIIKITQMSFHCGHIVSEFNGGLIEANNLKPICQSCNSSIGTENMDDFMAKYNL
jgi:uncharacterized membrane protein YheB (UPF0754 family)